MIESTESESLVQLDRFCEAMIQIREQIRDIEVGRLRKLTMFSSLLRTRHSTWRRMTGLHPYSRMQAYFPLAEAGAKYWVPVNRIDNAYGDRNLICTCMMLESE
jgi:glycine cleavage system P protein (glycine dehydrogenase)